MKALLISTSDIEGGAARAAYRLHQSLKKAGVNSQMLVRSKSSVDRAAIAHKTTLAKLGPNLDSLPLKLYPNRDRAIFSPQWFPDTIASKVAQLNPDVICPQWVCNGYLQIETLAKFRKPIVWTLHDMWAFTGGCHYNQECDRYMKSCGACPQLNSHKQRDLSRWVWQRKQRAWKNLNLTLVTPSTWLAQCAKESSLFQDMRVEVIPYGLDIEKYKPTDRRIARTLLNLPQDKQIILFGAAGVATDDPRKGFYLLQSALQKLDRSQWQDQAELVVFGATQPEKPVDLGFKAHYLGRLYDDLSLALVYAAADVMIVPSIQEAYGQTASESLGCGTPVVAFNATGLKDIVEHQRNGYLAQPFAPEDLARGIAYVLEDKQRHQKLCDRAREKAEQEFTLDIQAQRYLSLFTEILNDRAVSTSGC